MPRLRAGQSSVKIHLPRTISSLCREEQYAYGDAPSSVWCWEGG
jgi:hypothetical protein